MVVATAKLNAKPLANASVAFFVQRTFGRLSLGADTTLDDGTAAVALPTDLPGGANGQLQIIAEVKAAPSYAATEIRAELTGGTSKVPEADPFPRALWAPRAPLGLILTLVTLLSIVWSTYAFVITQLIKIRKGTD